MTESDPILPGGEAGLREALAAVISDTLLNWLVVTPGATYADNVVDAIVDIIVAEPLAQLQSDRTRLEAENERLRAALKPFGECWKPYLAAYNLAGCPGWPSMGAVTIADLKRANDLCAALAQPQPEGLDV